MNGYRTNIGAGGRIVIPAGYRNKLNLRPGDEVLLVLEEGEVRILTRHRAIQRAQELVRRYIPEGQGLVEDLLRERREEAGGA